MAAAAAVVERNTRRPHRKRSQTKRPCRHVADTCFTTHTFEPMAQTDRRAAGSALGQHGERCLRAADTRARWLLTFGTRVRTRPMRGRLCEASAVRRTEKRSAQPEKRIAGRRRIHGRGCPGAAGAGGRRGTTADASRDGGARSGGRKLRACVRGSGSDASDPGNAGADPGGAGAHGA